MATLEGGDEVGALVIDVGSCSVKMGYAGEDTPKAVFPSSIGALYSSGKDNKGKSIDDNTMDVESESTPAAAQRYYVGTDTLYMVKEGMEMENPLSEGLVNNWDLMERLLEYGLKKRLGTDPKQHPILLAEPSFNTRELREKTTEMMFEKYQVPALFLSKNAVLSTFAYGRSSALVLDSGGGVTTATAVHDGFALIKSLVKSNLSGDMLTRELLHFYESQNVSIPPRYSIQRKEVREGQFEVTVLEHPGITQSYNSYMKQEIARDIKETTCRVSEAAFDEEANANIPTIQYELPDGKTIECGTERFRIPEMMFFPEGLSEKLVFQSGGSSTDPIGVHQMVYNCIMNSDTDARKELYNSLIVTGGNTLLPGFCDRLHTELSVMSSQRFKIMAANFPSERKYSVWIGGSILGSLGTFQQMWMSKAEYEEHGPSLVERKCP